jgi:hypothetical protein
MRYLQQNSREPYSAVRPRRRPGFSLAEAATVVVLLSMLLAMVVSFLVGLHRYDAKFRRSELSSAQLARLAETIRADIRQATAVTLPNDRTLLVTIPGSTEIRYEIGAEGCRRTVNKPAETQALSDIFRIESSKSWTLETGEFGRKQLQIVSLYAEAKTAGGPKSVTLLVQAALGADRVPGETNTN